MRKTFFIALKELRQVRRDPFTLLMLLGLPAFMLVLYGFALNFDVRHVAVAVQDRDLSAASRTLTAAFVNSTFFELTEAPGAGADLERLTEERRARGVLVIPEGYGRTLAAGGVAPVQLLIDGTDATTATAALGYATSIVAQVGAAAAGTRLSVGTAGATGAIHYEPRVWYNPELSSTQFLVPGLIGFILMLTAVLSTAMSVVREKERGTMEQIRVSPVATWQLILGKTLPYLVISLLATVIILVSARILFGVAVRGPYLHLFAATLLYLLGALAFGLLLSTVAHSQAMAFQMGLGTSMLPALLLSGFIFQIASMPRPLQWLTYVVPARYYLVILRGIILKGSGLGPYWGEMARLGLFTAVVLLLASRRLARREA